MSGGEQQVEEAPVPEIAQPGPQVPHLSGFRLIGGGIANGENIVMMGPVGPMILPLQILSRAAPQFNEHARIQRMRLAQHEGRRLFLGNMRYRVTKAMGERLLRERFDIFGQMTEVNMMDGKGFGYITYTTREAARRAIEEMQGCHIPDPEDPAEFVTMRLGLTVRLCDTKSYGSTN